MPRHLSRHTGGQGLGYIIGDEPLQTMDRELASYSCLAFMKQEIARAAG